MNMENMTLRLYDLDLLSFTIQPSSLGFTTKITSVNQFYIDQFPVDLELSDYGLKNWLRYRIIHKKRPFFKEIMQSLGLKQNDLPGLIRLCKGLSLNDSYWIVPTGFEGKFCDYNLYENPFSEALSLTAHTGSSRRIPSFTGSPELTTAGMLPKAWKKRSDGIFLYKGNGRQLAEYSKAGNEPYSEFYASQVAKSMGISAVTYGVEQWGGILSSTCKLFNDINTAYVPIGRLIPQVNIAKCIDYADTFSEVYHEQIRSMLIFDCLICNEDRHFGNFGILRDNHTGKVLGPAPLYDHGLSLFSQVSSAEHDLGRALCNAAEQFSPFYDDVSIDDICRLAGKTQKAMLRRLKGFHFKKHPLYNWSDDRINITEHILRRRAEWLSEKIG